MTAYAIQQNDIPGPTITQQSCPKPLASKLSHNSPFTTKRTRYHALTVQHSSYSSTLTSSPLFPPTGEEESETLTSSKAPGLKTYQPISAFPAPVSPTHRHANPHKKRHATLCFLGWGGSTHSYTETRAPGLWED